MTSLSRKARAVPAYAALSTFSFQSKALKFDSLRLITVEEGPGERSLDVSDSFFLETGVRMYRFDRCKP